MTKCQYAEAEQKLQEALLADSSYGPAHNTLGKLYFDQRRFYLAAWEFEKAMKTMPHRAEPVNNLGLVYESVEQVDNAIYHYEQAVSMAPANAEYLGNLVRARIRRGDKSFDLKEQLRALITLDNRKTWVDWARGQLALGRIDDPLESYEHSDFELGEGEIMESLDGDQWGTITDEPAPAIEPPLESKQNDHRLLAPIPPDTLPPNNGGR